VDPEEVIVGMHLGRVLRSEVRGVLVHPSGALTLQFEGGYAVTGTTDADIVDWQWCLAPEPTNPYVSAPLMRNDNYSHPSATAISPHGE